MVFPQLSQAENTSHDYSAILDHLKRVYDSPNNAQEVEGKLLSLSQGTDSVHAYMAKFERVLFQECGQDWPDVEKISTFRNGLNSALRNRLRRQLNIPRRYTDFVRTVQQLAGRSSGSGSAQPSSTNHHSSRYPLGHDHSEPTGTSINPITIGAIDFSSPPPQTRPISPLRRGQCVHCGFQGHLDKDCPLKAYFSVASSSKEVTTEALDDDYPESESLAFVSSYNCRQLENITPQPTVVRSNPMTRIMVLAR
jgi:hypothetical protein